MNGGQIYPHWAGSTWLHTLAWFMKNRIKGIQAFRLPLFKDWQVFHIFYRPQNNQVSIMDVNDDNEDMLAKAVSGLAYELKVFQLFIALFKHRLFKVW